MIVVQPPVINRPVVSAGIEAMLNTNEQAFQQVADYVPQLMWMANADGWRYWFNQRWYEYTGTKREDMQGWGWTSVHNPAQLTQVLNQWNQSIQTGEPFEMVFSLRGADGVFRPFLNRMSPAKDEKGKVIRWFGINMDISVQQEVEFALQRSKAALKESEALFRTVTEAMPQLVWSCQPDGYHDFYNQRWRDYTGIQMDALKSIHWLGIFHPDDIPATQAAWEKAMKTGEPYEMEYRLKSADGSYRWFLGRALPIRDEITGQVMRWFGTCTDIEDMVQARQVLQQHKEELEQAVSHRTVELQTVVKELETFSYSISHDLRAPLRSIDGFSQALLRSHGDQLDDTGKDYLKRICRNTQHMGLLINGLLQLSHFTRHTIRKKRVNLSLIAREIADELLRHEPDRQVVFVIEDNLCAMADYDLMHAVIQNFLSNAWKFTGREAQALIEFRKRKGNRGEGPTVFFVRDNGAGFDMKHANKLFGPFQRLHGVQEFNGTGIGLATVARIVQRHGGRVWAESEPDKGATFYFTLEPGAASEQTVQHG